MAEPVRIRDLRVSLDPATVDSLTDAALRDRILSGLPGQLDRATAEATAIEVAAAVRRARRRLS
jgi:hypothetical protein